jgi:hypothetical protein
MSEKICVYIGAGPEEELPYQILRYSILRRCSCDVEIVNLKDFAHLVPERIRHMAATSFSFARLTVPAARNYSGIAAYIDSDMVCIGDIAEMFRTPFPSGKSVLCPSDWQTASMLIDCERTKWNMETFADDLVSGRRKYGRLLNLEPDFKEKANTLGTKFNAHDRRKDFAQLIENEDATLVHFTRMDTQPHLKSGHSHESLWTAELVDAIREGFIEPSMIMEEIEKRHVRPSLSVYAGRFPPPYDDRDFVPPFRRKK